MAGYGNVIRYYKCYAEQENMIEHFATLHLVTLIRLYAYMCMAKRDLHATTRAHVRRERAKEISTWCRKLPRYM